MGNKLCPAADGNVMPPAHPQWGGMTGMSDLCDELVSWDVHNYFQESRPGEHDFLQRPALSHRTGQLCQGKAAITNGGSPNQ